MPFITSAQNVAKPINIYYEDFGKGKPVVFIHGWPLNSCMWEYQLNVLPKYGLRCITYDRRGFGKSDKPWGNYDYDTLAADLKSVIDELNLDEVTLVGFSMGGGEVARYIGKYGIEKIKTVGDAYMAAGGLLDKYGGHGNTNASAESDGKIPWRMKR